MPILFECSPIPDLRVIPVSNLLTRACLAPCFLNGVSAHHTIPHRFEALKRNHFDGGSVDTVMPSGKGSKLYELNMFAMTCGRAKERIIPVKDEIAARSAIKTKAQEAATAKKQATWAAKRAQGSPLVS
jgi:hypothetical protein